MPRRTMPVGPVLLPVLEPMLASPGPLPPRLEEWAAEVKWDGMRVLVRLDGAGGVELVSRAGNPATARFPEFEVLPDLLPGRDAILDGEIVALDEHGRPSFSRLQERMPLRRPADIRDAMQSVPAQLLLFDVLWLDGAQTTALPYAGRGALLDSLDIQSQRILVPPGWPGQAAREALAWTRERGLEGVVLKRLDAPYRPGTRSKDWIKIKHVQSLEATIGAWIPADPHGTSIKALLLGIPGEPTGLRYLGAVGSGFTEADRRALATALRSLHTDTSPFAGPLDGTDRGEPVHWVRPVLRGEVEFLELTADGRLRQPVWKGLRGPVQDEPPPY
jgi:bifunctional non-homologous end joining protein LigD